MNLNETAERAMAALATVLDENTAFILILGHPACDAPIICANSEPEIFGPVLQAVARRAAMGGLQKEPGQ